MRLTNLIVLSIFVVSVFATEEKKVDKIEKKPEETTPHTEEKSKQPDKRGIFDEGYDFPEHEFGSEALSDSNGHSEPQVITKNVHVPQPYPVHVDRPVPVPIKVPVDRPYPVEVPVKVPVIHKVEVPVPKPYPVPVPHPVIIEKKVPVFIHQKTDGHDDSDSLIHSFNSDDSPHFSGIESEHDFSEHGSESLSEHEHDAFLESISGHESKFTSGELHDIAAAISDIHKDPDSYSHH